MLNGHGDDLYKYKDVKINFSSNVYNHFDHSGLYAYLAERMPEVTHYPDPTAAGLEAEIAQHLSVSPDEVMVTNGATEVIYMIAQNFPKMHSLILGPTFSEYADACRMHKHREVEMLQELPPMKPYYDSRMVWICNPNNPTGRVLDKEWLIKYIRHYYAWIFIIDASYAPFTQEPLITPEEAIELGNVYLIHSMTKEYAVPGLRIGYVISSKKQIEYLREVRLPWSVNQLAQDAGHYLINHTDEYAIDLPAYLKERERVSQQLAQLDGLSVEPSHTHILLCHLKHGKASELKDFLYEHHGILIRDASNFEGLDEGTFRIAVQSPEENDVLVKAIQKYLEQ